MRIVDWRCIPAFIGCMRSSGVSDNLLYLVDLALFNPASESSHVVITAVTSAHTMAGRYGQS